MPKVSQSIHREGIAAHVNNISDCRKQEVASGARNEHKNDLYVRLSAV